MKNEEKALLLVYIPVRYGQVLGVYADQQDAMQVVNTNIAKGQPCDLLIKSVFYPQKPV